MIVTTTPSVESSITRYDAIVTGAAMEQEPVKPDGA